MTLRRLIGTEELAGKLGYTREWVTRHWTRLVADKKFPPPLMGGERGALLKWDEKAVDLWMDSFLPEWLSRIAGAETRIQSAVETMEKQRRLQARAREIAE